MKKLVCVFVCLVLAAALSVTVFAAETAEMTIEASEISVSRGDTVSFTVKTSEVKNCRSAGILLSYDKSVFTFAEGKCSQSGTILASFSNGNGAFAFSKGKKVSGEIFTFQLQVKEDAAFGTYSITAKVSVRDTDGTIPATINALDITVVDDGTQETQAATKPTEDTVETTKPAKKPSKEESKPADTEPVEETKPADTTPVEGTEPADTVSAETTGTVQTVPADETEPSETDGEDKKGFPWWAVILGVAAGAVIGIVTSKKK